MSPALSLARSARPWAAALLGAAALLTAMQARAALHVEESTELAAPPEKVWALVGQFGSLAWHPVVAETRTDGTDPNRPGCQRTITTRDGARLVEALQDYRADERVLSYRIVESPLPVSGYRSTLRVLPAPGGSRVVWSSDFERDPAAAGVSDEQAREIVAGIYRSGFEGLRGALGAPR